MYRFIVGCNCYIFNLNRSINSKRQFFGFATIAYSGRYDGCEHSAEFYQLIVNGCVLGVQFLVSENVLQYVY